MWPKGLSGNNGYETLQIYREPEFRSAAPLVILMYQLAAGQSQLLTPKGTLQPQSYEISSLCSFLNWYS